VNSPTFYRALCSFAVLLLGGTAVGVAIKVAIGGVQHGPPITINLPPVCEGSFDSTKPLAIQCVITNNTGEEIGIFVSCLACTRFSFVNLPDSIGPHDTVTVDANINLNGLNGEQTLSVALSTSSLSMPEVVLTTTIRTIFAKEVIRAHDIGMVRDDAELEGVEFSIDDLPFDRLVRCEPLDNNSLSMSLRPVGPRTAVVSLAGTAQGYRPPITDRVHRSFLYAIDFLAGGDVKRCRLAVSCIALPAWEFPDSISTDETDSCEFVATHYKPLPRSGDLSGLTPSQVRVPPGDQCTVPSEFSCMTRRQAISLVVTERHHVRVRFRRHGEGCHALPLEASDESGAKIVSVPVFFPN
jgi:hypothetical protein